MKMGIKNVFKWRVTTNKYLYLTDEKNQAPFILDKRTGYRTYPQPISGSTVTGTTVITGMTLDEGLISQTVSKIKSADSYSEKYDKMVELVPFDNDASKLTFLEYDKYFNLDGDECVEEAVTPKCEGYEPVFNVSAYTLQNSGETEVEYSFYAERNEADKTLRYNLDLGIPRGEKGEKGEDGIGCKGDKGDDGLDAIISNVDADVTVIDPYEEPSVEVVSSKTGDNEYELNFNFRLPRGEQGEEGPVGDDGEPGWDAVVNDITTTTTELAPGSTPYAVIPSSSITVHDNTEDKVHETSFRIDFGLPTGLQGIQGNDGLNAEIRNVTARVIETLEPGYWDPNEYDENRRWIRNNAEAGVTVTPDGGGNVVDLDFWFKIPRGDKGDTGSGGTGDGGWIYNFIDPQFIPKPGLQTPIGDWDLRYHPLLGEVDVYLQIYYPEDWGGGGGAACDDDCRKHRYDYYQNNSDSLSEGMLEVINGILYPLATAQGTRSHAEGIGISDSSSFISASIRLTDAEEHINFDIDPDTLPDDFEPYVSMFNGIDITVSGHTYQVFCDKTGGGGWHGEDYELTSYDYIVTENGATVTDPDILNTLVGKIVTVRIDIEHPNAIGVATHTEGRACRAVGEYSHAEGWNTLTRGPHSHTEGLGTYTTNLSEHAEGQYNVSHSEDRTDFNNSNGCSTVSSIGIGEDDENRKNAIEVMQNGDVYIYGVGNYDGTEVKCQDSNIQTLQDVLINSSHGAVTNIATGTGLTGGPITSSGTISHADTSSQSSVTNSGRSYIQSIGLDGMGHVTSLTSATETVTDTHNSHALNITNGTPSTQSQGTTITYVESVSGCSATSENLSGSTVRKSIIVPVNTDYQVQQSSITTNAEYCLLAKSDSGTGNTTVTSTTIFATGITINPADDSISCTSLISNGDSYFSENIYVSGETHMESNLYVSGETQIGDGLWVTGDTYMVDGLQVSGLTQLNSGLTVTGASADITDGLNITGNTYCTGAYYASGTYSSSDIRKKNVLEEISLDKAYELVNKCQTIFYTWKDDETKKKEIGLIAQEVQQYFPELVSEDSDGYLTLDYSKLTVILLTVIRDLTRKMNNIEDRLKSLEDKLK